MGLFGMSIFPDATDLFGGLGGGGGPFGGVSGKDADWIRKGFGPAFDEINKGTSLASDFLRQGYEDMFRSRAQGMLGGYGEMASRLGAQTASQGLSPDVVQRLLLAPGQELQAGLGAAGGEAQGGLAFDLAKLYKGTGGELAGLTRDQMAVMANYLAALKGQKAQERAGIFQGLGGALGGFLGNPGLM